MGAELHEYAKALRLAAAAAVASEREGLRAIGICPVEGCSEHVFRVEKFAGVWSAVLERGDLDGELEVVPPGLLSEAGLEYCGMVDDRGPLDAGGFRTGFAWPV